MKCTYCGGDVEGWYASVHEFWDGEPDLQRCAECGVRSHNHMMDTLNRPDFKTTVEKEYRKAENWGYVR